VRPPPAAAAQPRGPGRAWLMAERLHRVVGHLSAYHFAASSGNGRAAAAYHHHVVVVGATGVVGRACTEHFSSLGGWRITMVSRRPPAYPTTDDATHLSLDLTDADACMAALSRLSGVTHLIYTALHGVNISDPMEIATNTDMLRNVLEPLAPMPSLMHVSLLQGRKAYAAHNPARLHWPLKESHPEQRDVPSWYWTQQDLLLRHRSRHQQWTYTIWRPPTVLGFVPGAPLSMITALGVFAAVSREMGVPLRFPGAAGPPLVKQLCDSRLLARALAWAAVECDADSGAAADQTFNVANGDVFLWQAAFPALAGCFSGLTVGPPQPVSLTQRMSTVEVQEAWSRVVARHGLKESSMERLVGNSWYFSDINLQGLEGLTTDTTRQTAQAERSAALGEHQTNDGDDSLNVDGSSSSLIIAGQLMSMSKLQLRGFNTGCDTEAAVVDWIKQMQHERYLPR
jgi:nucleoside-diphosphate-sugar epimerase